MTSSSARHGRCAKVAPEAGLAYLAVLLAAIALVVILLWGKGEKMFAARLREIEQNGYVVDTPQERHRGTITRVWGRYEDPVPFYLHLSNRDAVASFAGRTGIADLRVGHAAFDAAFFVRSNKPEWAMQFLNAGWCERLVRFESIQFCTAAIGSLLSPDYWPAEKRRDRRDLWMLRIDGRQEGADLAAHVALALELSAAVRAFCAGKAHEAADLEAGIFEGR